MNARGDTKGTADPAAARVVTVALAERSYEIALGSGLLAGVGARLASRQKLSRVAVIADAAVAPSHAAAVVAGLQTVGAEVVTASVPAGETSKSLDQVARLWQWLLESGADRRTVVVAVGGGVVGDLAGFVAATFARGLDFWQVPTTLLAMVDSSVGGKVGINLPSAKNMVGAFWQPRGVVVDVATLATLPKREYLSGLAEVVKYGVILDERLFDYVQQHAAALVARQPAALEFIIARSCELKAEVVRQDERETTGLRAILNYGHTFAHAIEAVSGYGQWLHGEAVAAGMVCAARLAERLGRINADLTARQTQVLAELGLPTRLGPLDAEALIAAMAHDKKVEHGRLRFVLPSRLGAVELVGDVPCEAVRQVLAQCA